jgi:O-succinylbenzoic acid--CoA ligase
MARHLGTLGIGAGDRVALLMRNGLPFVTLIHAISRLGAILVPLNTRLALREIGWQLEDVGAQLLVHDHANAQLATQAAGEVPAVRPALIDGDSLDSDALTQSPQAEFAPVEGFHLNATHSILYTSGTTGHPKGVVLTYGNHWWSAIGSGLNLGLHHDDRWLACLPLFHVGGLAIALRSVIYGVTAIVHESADAARINRAIDEEGVTIVSVVSAVLRQMLEVRGDRPYPTTLRCVLLGGGPAPMVLLQACARLGVPVVQTYGLTEAASQVATLSPEDAGRKLGSAGKPLLPTEVRIERDEGEARAGEVGEIVIRGPTLTPGYAGRPEATAHAFRGGWFHTGDLGYCDEEGFLYVLDRRDDLIVSGGENVYPAEVETVLLAHPAVEEAGVTGMADERWGQVPVAFVKARQDAALTQADLKAFCYARLARYKVPAHIHFVDSLPRNAAGKLVRQKLWESLSSREAKA